MLQRAGKLRGAARVRFSGPAARLLLALPLLTGCISEAQEQQIGNTMAIEINAQLPLVRDPLLNAYVTRMGRDLAAVSERPNLGYRFYIVNSGTVNAFALPGGHIYLTRGLLERARTGPELAGVLAHEIGHVAARHGVQKLQRHLRTGSLVGMLYQLILGGEPTILRQNGLRLAGMLWSASHSREDEEEADRLAVEYLVRSGLDPRGIVSLLETLLHEEASDTSAGVAAWFSSHPLTRARIEGTQAKIAKELRGGTPASPPDLPSYSAILRRIDRLPPPPDAL